MSGDATPGPDAPTPDETEDGAKAKLPFVVPDWLVPAAAAAVFALIGVIAGGAVAYIALAKQASRQQADTEAHEVHVARGTARLMDVEFRAAGAAVTDAITAGHGPGGRVVLRSAVSVEEQRELASAMTPTTWARVAVAAAKVPSTERRLSGDASLTKAQLSAARADRRAFKKAASTLSGFAKGHADEGGDEAESGH